MARAARGCGRTSAFGGARTEEARLRRARLKGGRGSTAVGQGRSMVARLGVYEAAVRAFRRQSESEDKEREEVA